jgi:hypothetical protein
MVPTPLDNAPVLDLCSGPEKRLLLDLIQQEEPGALAEHPIPDLYALLRAIERMWGGAEAKQLTVPPELIYQNMAEDHTCKGVGECHPYREFEGMQPSR